MIFVVFGNVVVDLGECGLVEWFCVLEDGCFYYICVLDGWDGVLLFLVMFYFYGWKW